jgi:hypothetical protein
MKKYNYKLAMSVNEAIPIIEELKARGVIDVGHMPYRLGSDNKRLNPEVEAMYPATPTVIRWSDPPMKMEITSEVFYDEFIGAWLFDHVVGMPMDVSGKRFKIIFEEIQ